MTDTEFRDALVQLGLTQQGFAKMVGAAPRTGQKWGLGESRIPGSVVLLLRLLLARPELVGVLRELGRPAVRRRDNAAGGKTTARR